MFPDCRRVIVLVAVLIASMGCRGEESSPEELPVAGVRSGAAPGNHAATVTYGKGKFAPTRVEIGHRALAVEDGEERIWVWIGARDEYERLIQQGS